MALWYGATHSNWNSERLKNIIRLRLLDRSLSSSLQSSTTTQNSLKAAYNEYSPYKFNMNN